MTRFVFSLGCATLVAAQKFGTIVQEQHPTTPFTKCTVSGGCSTEPRSVVLDSNWRWIHDSGYTNCYKGAEWDPTLCPDRATCSANCHLEGVDANGYANSYGVISQDRGIQLNFVTGTTSSKNYGSRIYLLDASGEHYEVFKLLNKEFSLTVDVSTLPCGVNGAVYFVEMDGDGGIANSGGKNTAGAKYGTGYCDAQCPHDMKFIKGNANSVGWNASSNPPIGALGSCCAEMDIWEANAHATAYTPHPCSIVGNLQCEGANCGDNEAGGRYSGVCDKDGCDFNSYRMGAKNFYGLGGDFSVDTSKEVQIVTQFITSDGTDSGDLVAIKRIYVQDGKVIANSDSTVREVTGNDVTNDFCNAQKDAFGDINDFKRQGGLKAMGEAVGRGVVLVMSLWDDSLSNMLWLDSSYPRGVSDTVPGVGRGPCLAAQNTPDYVRSNYPDAKVKYYDIKVGEIGSTFKGTSSPAASPTSPPSSGGDGGDGGDDGFGPGNRRLEEVMV